MAIDLFTTTGARMNEVMQIRLTEDCIVRLKMPPPPEARDQSLRVRYVLRLIPKGEKADIPQDYFIGEETKRLFVKVAQMLGEHYHLRPGQALPSVAFRRQKRPRPSVRKAPYLFQYSVATCRRTRSPHACDSCYTAWCLRPVREIGSY